MKHAGRWFSLIAGVAALCLAGCITPVAESSLEVTISQTAYGYEATANVGEAAIESAPLTVTATFTNISDLDFTVLEVDVTGPFELTLDPMPLDIASGDSIEASLSFDPAALGPASGIMEVTMDGVELPFVLNLAGTGVTAVENLVKMTVDAIDKVHGSSYDFGIIDPDAPEAVDVTVVNVSAGAVSVSAASGTAGMVQLGLDTPFTLAAGEAVAGTITMTPGGSGAAVALAELEVDYATSPFELNLAGEGNYAPAVVAFAEVTAAGTAAVIGRYERTTDGIVLPPIYSLPGTDYVIYSRPNDGIEWEIDDDQVYANGTYYRRHTHDLYSAPGTSAWSDWTLGSGGGATTTGEISYPNYYELVEGDVATPNYLFVDAEGDGEAATLFQWYGSSTPGGTYTEIPGETGSSITISTSEHLLYLKVLVTPVADDGTLTGEPVWFGPTTEVYAPVI